MRRSLMKILLASWKGSLHELAQVLLRRPCGDPSEVLSKRFLDDLAQVIFRLWGSCSDPPEFLVGSSCRDPWWNPPRGPCMISYRSLWEDLVEILLNSSVKRSLHLLALGSWRCSAWVLVWQFFWGLRRKFLYEDLVRYSIKKVLFWRPYEILLDVLVWGSGMKSWWVDIALLHAPKQIPAADAAVSDNV